MGSAYGGSGEVEKEGLFWTVLGTGLCAASANTLNQLYEVKRDALMSRTMARPLPAGKISKLHALLFAVSTGLAGIGVLDAKTDRTTTTLGAANIALYAGVYTPLKVIHPVNTYVDEAKPLTAVITKRDRRPLFFPYLQPSLYFEMRRNVRERYTDGLVLSWEQFRR